ncbi:MAG: DUF1805 domain-containing protein [Planctomycetaceae bacterium]|nr:DUF1805 domain-containing protein [Planctomycetaceae bacterium]
MGIESLRVRQEVIQTPEGEAMGCSYSWPGGQYCAIHTDRGILGCGIYDCQIAGKFRMAVAICRGTPEQPLREPEDLLDAKVAEASIPAQELGIRAGMLGSEALRLLLENGFTGDS